MIITINGYVLEDKSLMDKINDFSDWVVQKEIEIILKPLIESFLAFVKHIFLKLTELIPDLVPFVVCVLIAIGMFGHFSKWLSRATVVFVGGVVWLSIT